jgi:hypothetical protein
VQLSLLTVWLCNFLLKNIGTKTACKMLVKLTIGGLFDNNLPMICGGTYFEDARSECYNFYQNNWISAQSMSIPRFAASMTKYPSGKSSSAADLIVMGGNNAGLGYLSTLEVYGPTGWVSINAQLPEGIMLGCAITVNETTILMTGGITDSHTNVSSETFWFDSMTEKWSPGPNLNIARHSHGCGKIQDSNNGTFLIVSGGGYSSVLTDITDSTEILEPGSNEWRQGPKLPMAITEATMVEDTTTKRLLLVGGWDPLQLPINRLYQLVSPLTVTSQWEELPQKLEFARSSHPVAFLIPDHFVDCQEKAFTDKH